MQTETHIFDGLRFQSIFQVRVRLQTQNEWRWRPQSKEGYHGQLQKYLEQCLDGLHGEENQTMAAVQSLVDLKNS